MDEQKSPSLGRLGDQLLNEGLLSSTQLKYALQKQKIETERLGSLLVRHGLVQEYDVARVLASQFGIQFVSVDELPRPDENILAMFNRELCLSKGFLPIERQGNELLVLIGDGNPKDIAELVLQRAGARCRLVQGEFAKVVQLIRQSYYFAQNPVETLIEREVRRLAEDVDHAYSPEKLLDYLMHLAVGERSTDIHISPSDGSLHVLFRVDGVLRPIMALPSTLSRLIVFIKLMAEMDISEQRRPQDGSFHTVILELPFTIRISTIIGEYGERAVLRLLPERSELAGLKQLGFVDSDVAALEKSFAKPAGMVLITGPTGSGKSTTLHAALRMQSLIERNVLTVEDPVEYRLPGACQTEVNRRAGYEFSTALRHFLRHDPDVMLIGEIRDAETAQAAVEAASTGHLVLSTLHVGNVFGVIPRLQPLGLDAQTIADNLLAVVSQRLVRKNCPACSQPFSFSAAEAKWLGLPEGATGKRGSGCVKCGQSGYYGRVPVYEILTVNEELRNIIADNRGREALKQKSVENGFKDMVSQAKYRVVIGETTPEEVMRVVGEGPES